MRTRTKTNSFGTFLETVHGRSSGRQPIGDSLKLWPVLVASEPISVPELMRESKMDFSAFAASLEALQEADLVHLVGEPGKEMVELTPYGEQVAKPNA
jgi:predicted transcriptional regulator